MDTPIADFVRSYAASGASRLHMPGHKGKGPLGCEHLDLTEIPGADALYEADGIIARSEENAAALFGSGRTLYSTEGSSQCIRAMLYLALTCRPQGTKPLVLAARNVHKAFVYAAALLDLEVRWLWPREQGSLCSCAVTPEALQAVLEELDAPPACVYLTSPDYLGGRADVAALAQLCHQYGTILAVDNAHGAYLHFLEQPCHPLDLGADLCCDSAHKTLPVLTGGAYLHISKNAPAAFAGNAKAAMALFGSTSPSYLILASLDLCNGYLSGDYRAELARCVEQLDVLRTQLANNGWQVEDTDPLRLTLSAPQGLTGTQLAQRLREGGVECEFADPDYVVLMATPHNSPEDFARVAAALGVNTAPAAKRKPLPPAVAEQACSTREALFRPHETIPAEQGLGRVCAAPTVACPPAIPIVVSGEVITPAAMSLLRYYKVDTLDVLL